MISIVGTRQITSYGTEFCRKLIEDLAPLDPVIEWFCYGVDIVAHQFAMEYKLQTIGSCHGLNQIYPKPHKKICGQDGREWRFYDRILECLQS
jgi:DNA processing protein